MDSNPISVTIIEACKLFGISRSYLYQVMARGDVRSVKIGRRRVIFVDSLRSWLQSLSSGPLATPQAVTNRPSANDGTKP
jgi:excisionase family DNA binding protein